MHLLITMMTSRNMHPETVYCDGSCVPNPGPMEIAIEVRGRLSRKMVGKVGGNNQAELRAILWALEAIEELEMTGVVLITDSEFACKALSGRNRIKALALKPLVRDCLGHPGMKRVGKTVHVVRDYQLAGKEFEDIQKEDRRTRDKIKRSSVASYSTTAP